MPKFFLEVLKEVSDCKDGSTLHIEIENGELKSWQVSNSWFPFLYGGHSYCDINHDRKSEKMLQQVSYLCEICNITHISISPPYR